MIVGTATVVLFAVLTTVKAAGSSWNSGRPRTSFCSGRGYTAFERSCIVPDLIARPPREYLQVQYPTISVNEGNELRPEQVTQAPMVRWNAAPGRLYTVSLSDLDAPSRVNFSSSPINHWLVVNAPGGNVTGGNQLMPYVGSQPSINTGLHRYVFLVYEQPGRLNVADPALQFRPTLAGRLRFEIRQFARMQNLGNPIAGNFYQAQYSDYLATVSNLR